MFSSAFGFVGTALISLLFSQFRKQIFLRDEGFLCTGPAGDCHPKFLSHFGRRTDSLSL